MTEHNETNLHVFERIGVHYALPVSGWIGYLAAGGWMFGYIGDQMMIPVLLLVSAMACLYGHHARAMR